MKKNANIWNVWKCTSMANRTVTWLNGGLVEICTLWVIFLLVIIIIIDSAPSLVVYYFCRWLWLSVCHEQTSNRFFFFVSRWNRAIFGMSVLHDPLYKTLFFDFWFRPPNPPKFTPQICIKSPIRLYKSVGHWVSYDRYQWVIKSVIVCGLWTVSQRNLR